jgi:hypothetical protein
MVNTDDVETVWPAPDVSNLTLFICRYVATPVPVQLAGTGRPPPPIWAIASVPFFSLHTFCNGLVGYLLMGGNSILCAK